MFTFLTGSRRGRRDDGANHAWSPFARSPELSRDRAVGQTVDDEEPESDEDEDGEEAVGRVGNEQQPLLRPPAGGLNSYFDRRANGHGADGYDNDGDAEDGEEDGDEDQDDDEDDDGAMTPLLPIFSAAHLDRLPVYNITHAIRLAIVQRCETTLSWDQLRSPQVSQFLVKPIQGQIRANHFNRSTLCALIANCLQFQKEGQQIPANVGVSRTRALISELLAMRLIKEFSTRELIDALSYDFDPLQGMAPDVPAGSDDAIGAARARRSPQREAARQGARVSTIEIAIRAQAKRFLAHPVVVQHLEAIWAGTIVFHAEADSLHRRRPTPGGDGGYGTAREHSPSALPADAVLSRKAQQTRPTKHPPPQSLSVRRSVTLYDPREASLFKLSRLRVPRYRQVFSTLSFATLLGLFLAVLVERSLHITPLEVIFWSWSIGYMLDEVVGFTEQGFGLYILSFWNTLDLGILLLFVIYFCLRIYGIVIVETGERQMANYAYDVLASTAILLFPRLFSVLDHYRYFSQLLIAFRMMAQDLIAIMILIVIACSGFFVAFTLSFADEHTDANAVAFALFQIVLGFTPAAWDKWPGYNLLGKAIMGMFLIVCHFVIVTVLITVLTNSFMAIVRNAEEEHQFLFAVNTISMVKSDSLFSYVAPSNVIGWLLSPTRFILPFRSYLKLNRTIIKVTHFPLLFAICGYERLILSRYAYEPTELITSQPTSTSRRPVAMTIHKEDVFSPGRRLREPSVIGSHKDRALDAVFQRPFRAGSTIRTTARQRDIDPSNTRVRNGSVVAKWMQLAEIEGGASPPLEQPRSVVERLEHGRVPFRRAATTDRLLRPRASRDFSTASDPEMMSTLASRRPGRIAEETEDLDAGPGQHSIPHETDVEGDDEQNAESDAIGPAPGESVSILERSATPRNVTSDEENDDNDDEDGVGLDNTPTAGNLIRSASSASRPRRNEVFSPRAPNRHLDTVRRHSRKASGNTTLFSPEPLSSASPPEPDANAPVSIGGLLQPLPPQQPSVTLTPNIATSLASALNPETPINTPAPLRPTTNRAKSARPRPAMPSRQKTAPIPTPGGRAGLTFLDAARGLGPRNRDPSFNARALDLASDLGDNKWGPVGDGAAGGISGMPASFGEQFFRARGGGGSSGGSRRRLQAAFGDDFDFDAAAAAAAQQRRRGAAEMAEETGMVTRILLARMNRLEEGFREVLSEIKAASSLRRDSDAESSAFRPTTSSTPATVLRRSLGGGGTRADTSASTSLVDYPLAPASSSRLSAGASRRADGSGARKAPLRRGTAERFASGLAASDNGSAPDGEAAVAPVAVQISTENDPPPVERAADEIGSD